VCRYLDSDVIVGNALIHTTKLSLGVQQISFDEILAFEKKVSDRLEKEDCFIRFSRDPIAEFENDYPFFVSRSVPNPTAWEIKAEIRSALSRYFRDGLPPSLASVFEELDSEDGASMSACT
jgi:hypothetical protein